MPTTGLKKFLATLSKDQLIKHITELDKKYKPVQEYHQVFIHNDVNSIVDKLKRQIENEFYPARGLPKERLSLARKAVNDSKKLGLPGELIADLMLFYVETGVAYTTDYGDINEAFYTSMENMFAKALEMMQKENLLKTYQTRAYKITEDSCDTGWGFHDTLCNYYYEYYEV